jgi:hypothetical protein
LNVTYGGTGFTPVRVDLDGDRKGEIAIYQNSTGNWMILLSSANYTVFLGRTSGGPGYIPLQQSQ